MSDNKNYYYIKLKDNYFEQDNIKVLESMKNGHTYSLIIIKLYLKSSKYDGRLMMTSSIPYDPSKIEILASVIGHDVAHVKEAIKMAVELDLIAIVDGREIWMTEIQNFIGSSSTEADRKRDYRKRIDIDSTDKTGHLSRHLSDVRPPELEIEKKIEKEIKPRTAKALDFSFLDKEPDNYKRAFIEYTEHRKALKKAMNQQQAETMHKKLIDFPIRERISAIETSIASGWQGIFPNEKKKQEPMRILGEVNTRPTHCDCCGSPMVSNKCQCGRQLFCSNGVYTFEDGASSAERKKFDDEMRILL